MDHEQYRELCLRTEAYPHGGLIYFGTLLHRTMKFAGACGAVVDLVKTLVFYKRKHSSKNIADARLNVINALDGLVPEIDKANTTSLDWSNKTELSVPTSIIHGTLGHFTEAGEMADDVKYGLEVEFTTELQENFAKEIGDAEWYTSILLNPLHTDRPTIWAKNIAKLKKRFPEGFFTAERANNRDLDAEAKAME